MKNSFMSSLFVGFAIVAVCLLGPAGCDKQSPTQFNVPKVERTQSADIEVIYAGNESLEEMLDAYKMLVDSGIVQPLDEAAKQEMVDAFLYEKKHRSAQISASSQTVIAYTAHYVYSSDKDLWLEYKWWAGSRQTYHFETPIWSLYWAIRICYHGNILNWTWMEGGYQRVTAVVGSCVWVPFGSGFTRYYLRVVTN